MVYWITKTIILNLMGFSKLILMDIGTSAIRHTTGDTEPARSIPTVLIINEAANKVSSWGAEARSWLGRIPKGMYARYPVVGGRVVAVRALAFLVEKIAAISGPAGLLPRQIYLISPLENSELQRQVLTSVCQKAGFAEVVFLNQNMALALGLNLPITDFKAVGLLRLGAGSADFCIYAGGGYIFKREFRFNFEWLESERSIDKLPEVKQIWLKDLAREIALALSRLEPQAQQDIQRNGITVSGGVSQLIGLDKLLTQNLSVPIHLNFQEMAVIEGLKYYAAKKDSLDLDIT
jgi:actin-like ATPase involved in cell morphogenesis